MKNRVFRCIEGRARGFVGFLVGELLVGVATFGVFIFAGHALIGLGLGALLLFGLSTWRRRDSDRADYARVRVRLFQRKRGHLAPGIRYGASRWTSGGRWRPE